MLQPRRSRGASSYSMSAYSSIVFRPDAIFVLLRKAYKESDLGSVCRMVCHSAIINSEKRNSLSPPSVNGTHPLASNVLLMHNFFFVL